MSMKDTFRDRVLWASMLILGPMATLADTAPTPDSGNAGRCEAGMHGPSHPPEPPGGPGPHGGLGFGEDTRPPPFMMDVALTDEQQDKVFAILHAAAPALREREKAARKAREALHQLVRSTAFNDTAASTLAQAEGAADSQLTLLRTKRDHDVYAILTPEQQSTVATRDKDCDFHGRGGPANGGPPPGAMRPPH